MLDLYRTLLGVPSCASESSHAGWVRVAVLSSTNGFRQTLISMCISTLLEHLHLLQRDCIVHNCTQVLAPIRLHNDQVAHPDIECEVSQVEQVHVSGFEHDNVEWPGCWDGGQWDALAEIIEIGGW